MTVRTRAYKYRTAHHSPLEDSGYTFKFLANPECPGVYMTEWLPSKPPPEVIAAHSGHLAACMKVFDSQIRAFANAGVDYLD
jgi:hypothetical protein